MTARVKCMTDNKLESCAVISTTGSPVLHLIIDNAMTLSLKFWLQGQCILTACCIYYISANSAVNSSSHIAPYPHLSFRQLGG